MTGRDDVRGPPPCQHPGCSSGAHSRSGYTRCLEHDRPGMPAFGRAELEATGIATDTFTFFFGASCGSSRKTLRETSEPNVMLSYATRDRDPWDGIEQLMVDSGGYSLLVDGSGTYPDSISSYLDYVEASGAAYFMTRDVPCGDRVLRELDGGKTEAVARTVELGVATLEAASDRGVDADPVAVLQGVQPRDYVACYNQLVARDAVTSRLAIGSLKSKSPLEIARIVTAVRDAIEADGLDVELHGLGVEAPSLEYREVSEALASADSSRYISTARWRANRDELAPRLRDDEPRCGWYEVLRAYLDMREELREALAADVSTRVLDGAVQSQLSI